MKRILVPTDFSPNADKALNYAIQIARQAKAEVIIIHAVETYDQQAAISEANEKMDLIKKSITETEPVTIKTEVFTDSSVNSILSAIAKYNADIVVMGTFGSTGFKEKLYGSRTASVIGKSPVPVLAVPLLSEWKIPRKLILAINQFNLGDEVLAPVFEVASFFKSAIQLTIFTDTDDDYVEDYDEHELKIAAYRDKLQSKYPDIEIHAVHLAGLHFRESLQHWIDNNQIDMLAMLTHKRNFLESIFNSSKTKKMSYRTNIPLLSIPAK